MKTFVAMACVLAFFLLSAGNLFAAIAVPVPSEPASELRLVDEQFTCVDPQGFRTGYRHVYAKPLVAVYGWGVGTIHWPPVAFVYYNAQGEFTRLVVVVGPTTAWEYGEEEAQATFPDACAFPVIRAVNA